MSSGMEPSRVKAQNDARKSPTFSERGKKTLFSKRGKSISEWDLWPCHSDEFQGSCDPFSPMKIVLCRYEGEEKSIQRCTPLRMGLTHETFALRMQFSRLKKLAQKRLKAFHVQNEPTHFNSLFLMLRRRRVVGLRQGPRVESRGSKFSETGFPQKLSNL